MHWQPARARDAPDAGKGEKALKGFIRDRAVLL